jgi:hypothetical protein
MTWRKKVKVLRPENQTKKYDALFTDIDEGRVKIPKFQRSFVWEKDQSAKLIDSLIKGFPIGTFILWQTNEELRNFKNIGNIQLPEAPMGEPVKYVLDGQQRITSLYAVRKGVIFTVDGKDIDYKDICINLDDDVDSEEQIVLTEQNKDGRYISVFDLLNNQITDYIGHYSNEEIKKIDVYKNRLTTYDFSTVLILDYPLDVACEVFTRINTAGTELTLFEIMVAKTYDINREFDLAEKYEKLLNSKNNGKDLEDADYDTLPAQTILQCVSACHQGHIQRREILKIKKNDFIDAWEPVVNALFCAVDWVRSQLRIPVSELLPYNVLLLPITYFFYKNDLHEPNEKQVLLLQQYFWWASLTNRFSSSVETKIDQDLNKVNEILRGESPSYRGEEIQLSFSDLQYMWFSPGDAKCKAILCLYSFYNPRRFDNDGLVHVDNSWLRWSNSKNYHHFFPRAYLRNKGYEDWQANSMLNITIVDDTLNKKKIRARAPKDYMKEYKKNNKKIVDTMKSHLIDDLDGYGIWSDDYGAFLEQRGSRVLAELEKRLNPGDGINPAKTTSQ